MISKVSFPQTITLRVGLKEIHDGEPGCDCDCPLALALKRDFPGAWCSVTGDDIELQWPEDHTSHVSYTVPQAAKDFINRFDQGHRVHPSTFTLEQREP